MRRNRTGNIGKFERQLRKSVAKKIFILLGTGITLFIIGLLFVTYSTNRINAVNNLMMLKEVYKTLYQKNETFLLNSSTMDYSRNILEHIGNTEKLGYEFNKFNSDCKVKNQIILSDNQGKVLYTSYDAEELTHLKNYNSAICHNAKNNAEGKIYNSVFFSYGKYSDYIFVKPVYKNKEIIGFVSLYLSGDDWNYSLLNCNFDGVITDEMQNVIYASKPGLISQSNNSTARIRDFTTIIRAVLGSLRSFARLPCENLFFNLLSEEFFIFSYWINHHYDHGIAGFYWLNGWRIPWPRTTPSLLAN